MERNEKLRITEAVVAHMEGISRQDYGDIPVIGSVLSRVHARWAAAELIHRVGLRESELVIKPYQRITFKKP